MSELPPENPIPTDNLEQPEDLGEGSDVAGDEERGSETNDEAESDNELTDEMKAESERINTLANYLRETEQREEQVLQERYGDSRIGRAKRWLNTTKAGAITGTILNYGAAVSMIAGGVAAGAATGPVGLLLAPTLYALGLKKEVEQVARDIQEYLLQNRRRIELGGLQRELLEQRDVLAGMRVDDEEWVARLQECASLTQQLEEAQLADFSKSQRERFRASLAGSVTAGAISIMTGVPLGTHDFDGDSVTHAVRLSRRGLEFVYKAGEQAANGTPLVGHHALGYTLGKGNSVLGFAVSALSAGVVATTLLVSPWRRYQEARAAQPKSTESTLPELESIEPVLSEPETVSPVTETPVVTQPRQPRSIGSTVRRGLADLGMLVRTMGYMGGSIPIRFYNATVPIGPRLPIGTPPAIADKLKRQKQLSTTDATSAEADIQPEEQSLSEPVESEAPTESAPLTDVEHQNFLQYLSPTDFTEYDPDVFSQYPEPTQQDEIEIIKHERQRQVLGELDYYEIGSARALTDLLTAIKPEQVTAVVNNVRQQYLDFTKIFNIRPYLTTTTRAFWYDRLGRKWDYLNTDLKAAVLEYVDGLQNIAEADLLVEIEEQMTIQHDSGSRFEESTFMSAARELLSEAEYDTLKSDFALVSWEKVEPNLIMKVYRLAKKRRETQAT